MALSDFLKLVDNKLSEVFHRVPTDPTKARKPFIKLIDKAAAQFEDGKQPRGAEKWWSANNNVVAFTPRFEGKPVEINGEATHYIPAERFPDALKAVKASVEAGEFDALLNDEGAAPRVKAIGGTGEKKTRAPWSPERKAREAAAREARKAATSK